MIKTKQFLLFILCCCFCLTVGAQELNRNNLGNKTGNPTGLSGSGLQPGRTGSALDPNGLSGKFPKQTGPRMYGDPNAEKKSGDPLSPNRTLPDNNRAMPENFKLQKPDEDFDSKDRIAEIEKALKAEEEKAWEKALEIGTPEAFEKYLKEYPTGSHKYQAEKNMVDYAVNDIMDGEYEPLPGLVKIPDGSFGVTSTIVVKNNTGRMLTLWCSSKQESKYLTLEPGKKGSLTLKNGTYRIVASVNDEFVRNYAGSHRLGGGNYGISFYIGPVEPERKSGDPLKRR